MSLAPYRDGAHGTHDILTTYGDFCGDEVERHVSSFQMAYRLVFSSPSTPFLHHSDLLDPPKINWAFPLLLLSEVRGSSSCAPPVHNSPHGDRDLVCVGGCFLLLLLMSASGFLSAALRPSLFCFFRCWLILACLPFWLASGALALRWLMRRGTLFAELTLCHWHLLPRLRCSQRTDLLQ